MTVFTLAHLSDIHLGPLPRLGLRHCNAKRVLGYINWHKNRRVAHRPETLKLITADLAAQKPDHIAVTGDVANIGLPEEYMRGLRWLEQLGSPERVSLVPGNHDIYTTLRRDPGHLRWRAYMADHGEPALPLPTAPLTFPFVRRFGHIALIGVNSAIPTRPFYAGGRIGPEQLERSAASSMHSVARGLVRVVLIHHPPLPGQAPPNKALADADPLERILLQRGAELVLHGHNHISMTADQMSSTGPMTVVGVPSASLGRLHKSEPLARYHLFHFNSERMASSEPVIEMVARGLAEPGGRIVEIERRRILLGRPISLSNKQIAVEPGSPQA